LISPKVGGDTESCGEGERKKKKKKKRFRMSADMHLKNISSPHHHPSLSLSFTLNKNLKRMGVSL
jgi:hypothetical protein